MSRTGTVVVLNDPPSAATGAIAALGRGTAGAAPGMRPESWAAALRKMMPSDTPRNLAVDGGDPDSAGVVLETAPQGGRRWS